MAKYNVRRFAAVGFLGAGAVLLSACGGAPSESEVKDALMAGTEQAGEIGVDEGTWEEYVDCVVPKLMDNVSDDGLSAIVDVDADTLVNGGMMEISSEDNTAAQAAFSDCASTLTDAMMEDAGAASE